jgi:hypothetical protein
LSYLTYPGRREWNCDRDFLRGTPLMAWPAFAQILGKLFSFKFFENLRRIMFDYGQISRHPANAVFNGP